MKVAEVAVSLDVRFSLFSTESGGPRLVGLRQFSAVPVV
jgi:hypothetical protein